MAASGREEEAASGLLARIRETASFRGELGKNRDNTLHGVVLNPRHDIGENLGSSIDIVNVLKHEIRDGQLSFRGKRVLVF
ncbi:hypothetical protein Vadar_032161 [Vaccinium darrowii]|uniref:Uncharacterized protein n=1 Tax=Vaccinium darrowii TaxID=229202 RepID=A0ACB7XM54_9ERIC|nr:hypothetical protein Vadar_032161 [Vaccinium darrowii]